MKCLPSVLLSFVLLTLVACTACAKPGEVIDPAVAEKDPDFHVQGEYVGQGTLFGDASADIGAQVVALGDGKFDVKLFAGGLPGAGWTREDEQKKVGAARGEADSVKLSGGKLGGEIAKGQLTVTDADGKTVATLKKTVRKSPTLGEQPPKGAKVLFDGTEAEKYAEQWEKGKASEMDTLMSGCTSKAQFDPDSYKIHLEFRTSWMPKARGQGRSNSGVYIHQSYECQVLDSFGLEGRDNECGGFYKVQPPAVNMALPPLVWQTYDIEFTGPKYDESGKKVGNARATVRHNGVVIHDDLELPRATPGCKPEGPGPRALYLQGHGNKVQYRNIWVVE